MLSSFEEAFYHKSITSQLHKLRFVQDHTASTRIFDGLPVNLKDKKQYNSHHLSYVLIGLGFMTSSVSNCTRTIVCCFCYNQFAICTPPIIYLVCPPKFYITFVFTKFLLSITVFEEKLLMQNFGRQQQQQ